MSIKNNIILTSSILLCMMFSTTLFAEDLIPKQPMQEKQEITYKYNIGDILCRALTGEKVQVLFLDYGPKFFFSTTKQHLVKAESKGYPVYSCRLSDYNTFQFMEYELRRCYTPYSEKSVFTPPTNSSEIKEETID